jgi:hypothetical protein
MVRPVQGRVADAGQDCQRKCSAEPDVHRGFGGRLGDPEQGRDAARHFGITFPVWVGANGDDLYRLSKANAVPATIFIDRDGTIAARVSGEIRESELKERLNWLTGNRSGARPQEFVSHVK